MFFHMTTFVWKLFTLRNKEKSRLKEEYKKIKSFSCNSSFEHSNIDNNILFLKFMQFLGE
jgi:hypothetical protein